MIDNPWEVHADLTEDRLTAIGKIITKTRQEALQLYEPENGDGPWSLECRIYERTMNGFLAASQEFPWLQCIRKNLYFLVLIGRVPIRFKRKDFERAAEMDIKLFGPEISAHQLAFDFDQSGWYWRIFIETDAFREVLRLVLAQITKDGNTRNGYVIPTSEAVSAVTNVTTKLREAADIEKVKLGVKNSTIKKAANDGSN